MKLPSKKKKPQLEGAVVGDATKHIDTPKVTQQTDGLKLDNATHIASSTIKPPLMTKQQKKFGLISLAVLLVIVTVGLLFSGRLVVLWKQPKEQLVFTNRVCSKEIVATYNKASQFKQTEGSDQFTIDESGLKNLAAEVKGEKNYQSDPTCQTILLEVAIYNQDYNAAKDAYDATKNLYEKHIYSDSNLTGGPLSVYESIVQELSPSNKDADNQEPKGGG